MLPGRRLTLCKGSRCIRLQPGKWGFQVSQAEDTGGGRNTQGGDGGVSARSAQSRGGGWILAGLSGLICRWVCKDGEGLAVQWMALWASESEGGAQATASCSGKRTVSGGSV